VTRSVTGLRSLSRLLNLVATLIALLGATIVTSVDLAAFAIQATIDAIAFLVEAMLDAITTIAYAISCTIIGAVSLIGKYSSTDDQQNA
jgi:ABC-type uncharacterized transport system YnjBCD permease subunit